MSTYSVKRPITVLMGILIIIVLGFFSLSRLPLTLFPEINLPFVVTITTYEGESPETLELEVSKRIEAAVSTIGNFQNVNSRSNEHFAISIITFAEGSNMDSIIVELRELLNNIQFADGVGSTRILRITPDMLPVMTVTLFRTYEEGLSDEEILIRNTEWVNRDLSVLLQSIPGVADVSTTGGANVVLQISLDEEVLSTYGVTQSDVLSIIEQQNIGGLIGVALDSGEIRMLYLGDQPRLLSEIENLPILNHLGTVVRLSDLVVSDGIKYINSNSNVYSKINGVQGIQVAFRKQADYAITSVVDNIRDRLDLIVSEDDQNASYTVLLDQGEYIESSINSVLNNIIIGAILAIFILFLFLRDIKPTIIVGLAIPISVIATFVFMYFSNITLNLISMGGLALSIGMLVDNSIVVIENIYRMISDGRSKTEAAIAGAKQVAAAITASTITTAAVFLPILFIEGLVADVFMSMAYTIAFALGSSLLIALTMVPTMASRFLNDKKLKSDGKLIEKMKKWYVKSVKFTISHKVLTFVTVLVLFVSSVGLVAMKGFIFLPTSDEGTISISIDTNNQVPFSSKALFADLLTAKFVETGDIENISATIGGGGFMGFRAMGGNVSSSIRFDINLSSTRSLTTKAYALELQKIIDEFNYNLVPDFSKTDISEIVVSTQDSTQGFGQQQGIRIKVSGYDLLTLEKISNEIVDIIKDVDGVVKPDNGIVQASDNVKITVDRTVAMSYGLTTQDVQNQVLYMFRGLEGLGSTNTTRINIEGVDYEVRIPASSNLSSITFDSFGDYLNFLSGILIFDLSTKQMIDQFMRETNQGIYIPSSLLPSYEEGDLVSFIINPALEVVGNEIIFNPLVFIGMMPESPNSLRNQAIAPLYDPNQEDNIAAIEKVTGFATIFTDGSSRYLTVTARADEGFNITLLSQEVNRRVRTYLESDTFKSYGAGYFVTFEGESEDIIQAISELAIAAVVAILLVYMVMAIQFQSLVYPLIILGTIPLAFTGGMAALLITNSYLSIVSIMGLIILVGVVVNNGIVLIDYINKLRDKGYTVIDAIIRAGQTRLRPILMTALTTILALLTLALGFGEGSELLQPMAITSIGGLIYATILTLVVVPTVYALFNLKTIKKESNNHDNQG
jgi:multidrug efflux pump subunit AcrB